MKRKIKSLVISSIVIVVGYFSIGIILNKHVFPEAKPDLSGYFKAGDILHSGSEGFDQTILSVKDGWVHTSLTIQPHAPGPPEHVHTNMVEVFAVKEGVLSIMVNGEKKQINAGDSITIPVGTNHRPFNETDSAVVIESNEIEKSMTVEFAYHLSQIYPFVDGHGDKPVAIPMMLQLSVYGEDFDAYLVDGPPVIVQKAMRVILAPTARLLGYRNYYEKYRIR